MVENPPLLVKDLVNAASPPICCQEAVVCRLTATPGIEEGLVENDDPSVGPLLEPLDEGGLHFGLIRICEIEGDGHAI